jgi:hypothetical protein
MIQQSSLKFSATIQDRFEEFHKANPRIYDLLVRFALEVKGKGWKRYSIDAIYQRVRWHVNIETSDTDFKINDHFRSRYARLIMSRVPELDGFFEVRELKA